jgi:sortase A
MQILNRVERVLFAGGIGLLSFCAAAFVGGHVYSSIAVEEFQLHAAGETTTKKTPVDSSHPDFSLWDQKRVREYETSLTRHIEGPQAVLRIDKIHLVAPVLNGTDEVTLDRGVGRIIGTSHIGASGNVGIAGHRDGFFRGLKDVSVGDTVQLETETATQSYIVDKIQIVAPNDVSVLKNDDVPSLTLVTCYPFYFIGNAPQRYVVHASLRNDPRRVNQAMKTGLKQNRFGHQGE